MTTAVQPLSSSEITARTGLTYRRLDRWCRAGVLASVGEGMGSGAPRSFDPGEVRVIRFARGLADLGANLDVLALAAAQVREHQEWDGDVIVSRSGKVLPRLEAERFGMACWIVNLDEPSAA